MQNKVSFDHFRGNKLYLFFGLKSKTFPEVRNNMYKKTGKDLKFFSYEYKRRWFSAQSFDCYKTLSRDTKDLNLNKKIDLINDILLD